MRFWRNCKKLVAAATVTLLAMTILSISSESPAAAATGGCYGASCNGLDPMGRCDGDAKTVAAMAVTDGMLELRWSPSCVANWGRYSPYKRTVTSFAVMNPPIGIWARVTTWNPGAPSYGTAHNASLNIYESSWSYMTDGRPKACTGVEIVYHIQSQPDSGAFDTDSMGWTWGPCY